MRNLLCCLLASIPSLVPLCLLASLLLSHQVPIQLPPISPGTCSIDQAGFKVRDPLVSAFQGLRLKACAACTTTATNTWHLNTLSFLMLTEECYSLPVPSSQIVHSIQMEATSEPWLFYSTVDQCLSPVTLRPPFLTQKGEPAMLPLHTS